MHVGHNCRCHPSTCTTSLPQTRAQKPVSTSQRSPAPSSTPDNRAKPIARTNRLTRRRGGHLPRLSRCIDDGARSPDRNPDEVETLLDAGRLPVLGIATTSGFYDPTPPWVISPLGSVVGFHAVVAVGIGTAYTARRFLIRNSWGNAWADAGHAWLDDAFVVQHLHDLLVLTAEVR